MWRGPNAWFFTESSLDIIKIVAYLVKKNINIIVGMGLYSQSYKNAHNFLYILCILGFDQIIIRYYNRIKLAKSYH